MRHVPALLPPTRRQFVQSVSAASLGLLVGCGNLTPSLRPPLRIPRVGLLLSAGSTDALPLLRQSLHELGYVEGQGIVFEFREARQERDQLSELADELVRLPVDVIVAVGEAAIMPARRAANSIPIVMIAGRDPITSGHVASIARPGGHITGLSYLNRSLIPKR